MTSKWHQSDIKAKSKRHQSDIKATWRRQLKTSKKNTAYLWGNTQNTSKRHHSGIKVASKRHEDDNWKRQKKYLQHTHGGTLKTHSGNQFPPKKFRGNRFPRASLYDFLTLPVRTPQAQLGWGINPKLISNWTQIDPKLTPDLKNPPRVAILGNKYAY